MASPHPIELRERAVAAYESGAGGYDDVAEEFGIGSSTLQIWVKRKRELGTLAPSPRGGGNFSPVDCELLKEILAASPDLVADELRAAYNKRVPRSGRVHRSSITRALHRLGYVVKKNGEDRRNKRDQTWRRNETSSSKG